MKETGLRCNLCYEFFPHDQLVEKTTMKDIRPEKIVGVKYGIHGEMILDYRNPTESNIHICRGCLWQIREKTER